MKIVRAPENLQCDEVVKCIFDLNSLDIEVYKKLRELGMSRVDELASHLNRERSTVYRSLQKLTTCGICNKTTKTIRKGGYFHIYKCNDIHYVKKMAESCLDRWYKSMKQTLKLIDEIM